MLRITDGVAKDKQPTRVQDDAPLFATPKVVLRSEAGVMGCASHSCANEPPALRIATPVPFLISSTRHLKGNLESLYVSPSTRPSTLPFTAALSDTVHKAERKKDAIKNGLHYSVRHAPLREIIADRERLTTQLTPKSHLERHSRERVGVQVPIRATVAQPACPPSSFFNNFVSWSIKLLNTKLIAHRITGNFSFKG